MHPAVYHIVSGQVFFTGVVLVLLGILASASERRWVSRLTVLAVLLGVIGVAIASAALPYWYYVLLGAATIAWPFFKSGEGWRRHTPWAVGTVWLAAGLWEASYHFPPTLEPSSARALTIIGDSVTAGLGEGKGEETWPAILARQHNLAIQDISHVGETAASALGRLQNRTLDAPTVILEIGGNDLLGSTPSRKFAADLEALLVRVCSPGRQVVMFELPLPPFYHEYGRAQRSLAGKYNVRLLPKRLFLSILAGEASTLDTIHLSPAGHRRMAEMVWRIVGDAFPEP